MAVTIKNLIKLQLLEYLRSNPKYTLIGRIILVLYFWALEIIAINILQSKSLVIPPLGIYFIGFLSSVPDFLFKLLFSQNKNAMSSSLKTRPISHSEWERFLVISQLWKSANLFFPLMFAPICIICLPTLHGIIFLFILYCLSVFGGIIVLLLKYKGRYTPNNMAVCPKRPMKNYFFFRLDISSILRSKRMKALIIPFTLIFYGQCILSSPEEIGEQGDIFMFLFILFEVFVFSEYGMGIEANFFACIWTKPLSMKKLLNNKYSLGIILGTMASLLCLPICLASGRSVINLVSYYLFCSGFANMVTLTDSFNCVPYDLFGKVLFNSQGNTSSWSLTTILSITLSVTIGIASISFLGGWKAQLILSACGIFGICIHNKYFKLVESNFTRNKYKYMKKYYL